MSSRNRVLANVVRNQPERSPLPLLPAGSSNRDLIQTFQQRLEGIGGQAIAVPHIAAIADYLQTRFAPDTIGVHNLPELDYGRLLPASSTDAHLLAHVDWAVLTGEFGVAENGAVWLDGRNLPNRALPFICQHLVLVIYQSALVPTLHNAYRRLEGHRFDYGVFIAGPSKTADIEQSLVIGAHGPRSLVVFLLTEQ